MNKEDLMQLIKQKDEMEKTLAKLTEQIQQIDKIKNFDKGVIDREGFPREDLDFGELANYRNLKRRKAQLNNDHVKLMKEIETKLFQYHSTLPQVSIQQQEAKPTFAKKKEQKKPVQTHHQQEMQEKVTQQKYVIDYLTPFARISLVQNSSPAQLGGIKVNDLLSEFSQVNIYTPDNIKQIPYQVKENHQLKIVVMRPVSQQQKKNFEKIFTLKDKKQYAKVQLQVTPQKWSGRGLLGCKIDPL